MQVNPTSIALALILLLGVLFALVVAMGGKSGFVSAIKNLKSMAGFAIITLVVAGIFYFLFSILFSAS